MKKQALIKTHGMLIAVILFLTVGCNNGDDKKAASKPDVMDNTAATETALPLHAATGVLDTLWITATEFKKLDKNKADFIFYFGNGDTISVHGWKDSGGSLQFSTLPDVRFIKGKANNSLSYGPGTYFGNLTLRNVNKLIKKINDSLITHVIFAPHKLGNHVYYKIFLSREAHIIIPRVFALIPADDDANPSPPKNY